MIGGFWISVIALERAKILSWNSHLSGLEWLPIGVVFLLCTFASVEIEAYLGGRNANPLRLH